MIITHRITCITAFILLCHLLTITFTIKPLPSNGLWTLLFTQLNEIMPGFLKLQVICVLLVILLYSTITLRLQGSSFFLSLVIMDLSLSLAQAALMLTTEIPFYICTIQLHIDPIHKINFYKATLALYIDQMSTILQESPQVLEAFKLTIQEQMELRKNHLLITQMTQSEISTFAKTVVEKTCNISVDTLINPQDTSAISVIFGLIMASLFVLGLEKL